MKYDTIYLKRVLTLWKYRALRNKCLGIKKMISMLYLYGMVALLTMIYSAVSFSRNVSSDYMCYLFIGLGVLIIYLVFIGLNHIILSRWIAHKILLTFEVLTLLMFVCVTISIFVLQ